MPTSPGPYSLRSPRLHCAWPAGHAHPCNIERAMRRTIGRYGSNQHSLDRPPKEAAPCSVKGGRKPSECGVAIQINPMLRTDCHEAGGACVGGLSCLMTM